MAPRGDDDVRPIDHDLPRPPAPDRGATSGGTARPPVRPPPLPGAVRRQRDRWSPQPTTEEGRRRQRRARWATAGFVTLGVVFALARAGLHLQQQEERDQEAMADFVRDATTVQVVRHASADRISLSFLTMPGDFAWPGTSASPDVTIHFLVLPAGPDAIDHVAEEIAADLVRRSTPRAPFTFAGLDRDEERALAERVEARVRALLANR